MSDDPRHGGGTARRGATGAPAAAAAAGSRRRRDLLAGVSVVLLGALGWLTGGAWRSRPTTPRRYVVNGRLADGLTIDGPVALFRDGPVVTAVSRRCPHLGCEVRAALDGTLACPCHGSRFDARGHVRRGPATANLTPLPVRVEPDGKVVVELVG